MARSTYEIIKRQNGERFAKSIQGYDNGIFDIPNLPQIVKYAGRNAEPIMSFLVSLKGVKIQDHAISKDPFELLKEKGYNAYYADTLEKQNDPEFQKYFAPDEELCTFKDPERYKHFHILHVVKSDADNIRREDFKNPQREDKYGTSVMSIQILKEGGFIAIMNRYNHAVENADNTYNSDPDQIALGLSMALKRYFNVDFSSRHVVLPIEYKCINNQIFKCEYRGHKLCVGDGFYIHDDRVHYINKNSELMIDYQYVLNLSTKTVRDITNSYDTFPRVLSHELHDKKLQVRSYKRVDKTGRNVHYITKLYGDNQEILTLTNGYLTKLHLPHTQNLPGHCLCHQKKLQEISAPQLKSIGKGSLSNTDAFPNKISVFFPLLTDVADDVLKEAHIGRLEAPNIRRVGHSFCECATFDSSISLPKVQNVGDRFCWGIQTSQKFFAFPCLKKVGQDFFQYVPIKGLSVLSLEETDSNFISNTSINYFKAPNLQKLGKGSFNNPSCLKLFYTPALETVENDCLVASWFYAPQYAVQKVDLSSLKSVGRRFFKDCSGIDDFKINPLQSLPTDAFLHLNNDQKNLCIVNQEQKTPQCIATHRNMKHLNQRGRERL